MKGESLTWALLAPVPPRRLTALIDEYWLAEIDDDEEAPEEEGWRAETGWEVVGGTGDYSAILDRNPGSEGPHDEPLAERISRKTKQPVYVLYLNERYADADIDTVFVYRRGRETGSDPADPYAHARELGITLPGDLEAEQEAALGGAPPPLTSILLVEGAKAADVARALRVKWPPADPLRIDDGPTGAVLYNVETGRAPAVSGPLSKSFPKSDVYLISTGPDKGRFMVWLVRGGKDLGTFDRPVPRDPEEEPVLDSVKGETTPRAIAAALGVPTGLLPID